MLAIVRLRDRKLDLEVRRHQPVVVPAVHEKRALASFD